ncbi:VOC family protein [Achromobacter xylosoxidans]|uniref:VOC family protein n=1 Tax=Alcaligenes xylosoxydans xylosoxydans TaxID=85698 RepID=UPI001EEEEDAA|nr:VOC family protein [Achromobacter xylosoxidans]
MNLIQHVEIPAADLERAMRFYSRVLGIAFDGIVDLHDSRMAYFPFEEGTDGASGALAQGPAYLPTRQGPIVYFGVSDLDGALRRARALGSEVLFPKTPTGSGWQVAEIRDSEGNRIALQSRLP